MSKTPSEPVFVLGWREAVGLPEWQIRGIKAKVDTGARTSSLHVEGLEVLSDRRVRFHVVRHRGDEKPFEVTAKVHRIARVRPSTGEAENRYVVRTRMRIGPIERVIEISLVSREAMLCRMLVGRNALPAGTVVDPHLRYVHGLPLRRRRRQRKKKSVLASTSTSESAGSTGSS